MWLISNFNNDLSWIKDYTDDYVIYNQGEPIDDPKAIQRPHKGSDIYDKFSFIIDNYENLPDVTVMVKGNFLEKFITEEEFDKIKDNKTFTPILTQKHLTYSDRFGQVCWYENGMYCERSNVMIWWLAKYAKEITEFFKMNERAYNTFAPGSNYIVPKENILKHSKEVYEKLRSYLEWDVYPPEAQIIERNLFYLWS